MLAGDVFIAHVCWLLPTYVYFCPLAIHSRRNMFCEVPKAKIFLVFSIQNSILFLEAEKLCGSVELGLSPDAPLLVKYDLETADKGHMKFYLAPKIDEWWARFDSEAVLWHVWCCCLVQRFNTQCRVCFERRSAMYYGGKHCWGRSVIRSSKWSCERRRSKEYFEQLFFWWQVGNDYDHYFFSKCWSTFSSLEGFGRPQFSGISQ